MLALLLLSTIASLVASSVLGFRLLRMALRTREVPELAIGTSFIFAGVIGYVLMLASNSASGAVTLEQANQLFVAGYTTIGIGVCAVYVFIWRTFRPQAIWAASLAVLGIVTILATNHNSVDPVGGSHGPGFWVGLVARLGAGAWGAVESLRWWSLLQRRLGLGLADPVVVNRFLLWGLANGTTFMIFLSTASVPQQGGAVGAAISNSQILLISSMTMATAVFQWLAFFPSQRYVGWVRRRAGVSAS
jgi:hypothetical protein